jgi:hypothetical protein
VTVDHDATGARVSRHGVPSVGRFDEVPGTSSGGEAHVVTPDEELDLCND